MCTDGCRHWLRIALETVCDNDRPVYAIGKINVIDKEKREKETLLKKSQHDSLTHIYNAETSFELVSEALTGLGSGDMGALLLIDVDHFKSINDTYGHLHGDEILREVASLLEGSFRKEDIVGRPGGDEFIVYMKNIRDTRTLTEKMRFPVRADARYLYRAGKHLTVSIGAAASRRNDLQQALSARGPCSLQSKELGRDTFYLSDGSAANKKHNKTAVGYKPAAVFQSFSAPRKGVRLDAFQPLRHPRDVLRRIDPQLFDPHRAVKLQSIKGAAANSLRHLRSSASLISGITVVRSSHSIPESHSNPSVSKKPSAPAPQTSG